MSYDLELKEWFIFLNHTIVLVIDFFFFVRPWDGFACKVSQDGLLLNGVCL